MSDYRLEQDTMGDVRIPRKAYYGAQTQRAVENFPISGKTIPVELIRALGLVKWCTTKANQELGLLTENSRRPLTEKEIENLLLACEEVASGKFDAEFPIDVYQTGSGTSSNMNVNEVISNRAMELSGFDRFSDEKSLHPNDHVNMGQSTNDTFPTAIHVAVGIAIVDRLIPALRQAAEVLRDKSELWSDVLKIGRTHLADATPMTLGQEFGAFARQLELSVLRAEEALAHILELPVGGTAVGSGINTHPDFGDRVAKKLAEKTGISFVEAVDHFEANAQRDGLVACHAVLKTISVTLFSVANNIRWLASGPRCGFYEVILPELQPGSSIMPGKVNPVLCESLMQVAAHVIGHDAVVSFAGASGGQFQLNIMMPLLADTILESVRLLSGAVSVFAEKCLEEMEANEPQCRDMVEKSLSMVTGLNPYIGYEKAAALAKEAFATGKTIRDLCREMEILTPDELEKALDPQRMTRPLDPS